MLYCWFTLSVVAEKHCGASCLFSASSSYWLGLEYRPCYCQGSQTDWPAQHFGSTFEWCINIIVFAVSWFRSCVKTLPSVFHGALLRMDVIGLILCFYRKCERDQEQECVASQLFLTLCSRRLLCRFLALSPCCSRCGDHDPWPVVSGCRRRMEEKVEEPWLREDPCECIELAEWPRELFVLENTQSMWESGRRGVGHCWSTWKCRLF